MIQFLRTYFGFTVAYITYKTSLYLLHTFFSMVNETEEIEKIRQILLKNYRVVTIRLIKKL